MTDFLSFFTDINVQIWTLIINNWMLSIGVLLTLIGWVINMVNNTRNSH